MAGLDDNSSTIVSHDGELTASPQNTCGNAAGSKPGCKTPMEAFDPLFQRSGGGFLWIFQTMSVCQFSDSLIFSSCKSIILLTLL